LYLQRFRSPRFSKVASKLKIHLVTAGTRLAQEMRVPALQIFDIEVVQAAVLIVAPPLGLLNATLKV
jgi:hypothetical protein